MAYIRGEGKPTGEHDCPFCVIPTMGDEDGLIVARGTTVFAVLNLYPYNAGHLMLVPYRHVPDYTDLTADEVAELGAFTQSAMRVVRSVSGAHGFNIGMNQGSRRRRRHRRPPAPARRAALGRRHQLHAGHRPDPGAAAGAARDRALLADAWAGAAVPVRGGLSARPVNARPVVAKVLDPLVARLVRAGVTPDMVTITGTVGAVAGAVVLFGTGHLFWGTVAVTFFVLLDLLDGAVARARGGGSGLRGGPRLGR